MAVLPVDAEVVSAFARDGVACVRDVLDPLLSKTSSHGGYAWNGRFRADGNADF